MCSGIQNLVNNFFSIQLSSSGSRLYLQRPLDNLIMPLNNKKCLFLVQGEGRGHMTQSISMKELLEKAGMTVSGILIGKSKRREIPSFYYERIGISIIHIESPNMATDKKTKAIKAFPSLLNVLLKLPQFFRSLLIIHREVKKYKPDVIINFYEPLAGLYYFFFRPKAPMVCIGHHYMFNHPEYTMPEGHFFASLGLKLWTGLISIGAKKKLALSFYPFNDCKDKSIYIIPPLLRREVQNQGTANGNYLLVYLLNSGYMEDIIHWHSQNLQVQLHCFVDNKAIVDQHEYDSTLTFHELNDKKFLEMMANSKGLVTTSGFESVCEAMYLGKPVFMVPVEGHYEQYCNSRDASEAGAGIYDTSFKIERLLTYLSGSYRENEEFREWVNKSELTILKHIHNVVHENNNVRQLRPYNVPNKKVAYPS